VAQRASGIRIRRNIRDPYDGVDTHMTLEADAALGVRGDRHLSGEPNREAPALITGSACIGAELVRSQGMRNAGWGSWVSAQIAHRPESARMGRALSLGQGSDRQH